MKNLQRQLVQGQSPATVAQLRKRSHRAQVVMDSLESRQLLAVTPYISEFVAQNNNSLLDGYGNSPDWIEIHNPTAAPVNLQGMYLTDNKLNKTKWRFPSFVVGAGQYAYVFASGLNLIDPAGKVHTNFELSAGGEYLGLIAPDGATVLSSFDPEYPPQLEDISYGLTTSLTSQRLVGPAATVRTWVPVDNSLGTGWTAITFNDSGWTGRTAGVGFSRTSPPQRISGFTMRMVDIAGGTDGYIDNIGEAISILDGTAAPGAYLTFFDGRADYATINHGDGGPRGGDQSLPNGFGGTSADANAAQRTDYALRITADVVIPAGDWSINVNSDDGFRLVIPGVSFINRYNQNTTGLGTVNADTLAYGAPRGPGDTWGTFKLTSPLTTTITLDFYERGGGDEVELSIANGLQSSVNTTTFALLGDGVKGWSVTTMSSSAPPAYTPVLGSNGDMDAQMYGVNSSAYIRVPFAVSDPAYFDTLKLRVKYDDGFVAYLNGTEVARRYAPASLSWNSAATGERTNQQSMVEEVIDISAYVNTLVVGNNVLAFQGLNISANDYDFLLVPELEGIHTQLSTPRYMTNPTPGAANDPSNLVGYVKDTKFSHDRGFYDAPFQLTITTETPGAEIRYTLNGDPPTATTGTVYTGPITISGTTVIRAAAFKVGYISTNVDTQTYLFLDDVVTQSLNGQAPAGWPTSWGANVVDYGLDPDAVNSPGPVATAVMNGIYYFVTDDLVNGAELWRSNGTSGGTYLVKDIYPGPTGSYPTNLTVIGNTLYFTATDPVNGAELWKSDGTATGTVLVKDIKAGAKGSEPTLLTNVGGTLYFAASDGIVGRELWKSDGTAAGTVLVKDINPGEDGSKLASFVNFGGTLFFSAYTLAEGRELWKSNGTPAGTVLVTDINAGVSDSSPSNLTVVGGTLYFSATDPVNGAELWKTTGGPATLVRDINPGFDGSRPGSLIDVGGTLFFAATTRGAGRELWKSDGTFNGTVQVRDIHAAPAPTEAVNVNGTIFFVANNPQWGTELWRTDPVQGAVLVKDIYAGTSSSSPTRLTAMNGLLYFRANDGTNGVELWRSDGTSAGTYMVRNISSLGNSTPDNLTVFDNVLYFSATDGATGVELWKSDGTFAGTTQVKDIRSGSSSSNPAYLTVYNGALYFAANDGTNGTELWKSDGTSAGTAMLKNIYSGSTGSSPSFLTVSGGTLYFAANDGTNGTELWKSDGTAGGTVIVKNIASGSTASSPTNLVDVNGTLFFAATDGTSGVELYKSNGTSAGTLRVADISPSGSSSPANLTNVGGTLYFSATDGTSGVELWKSDGSTATRVKDIRPGTAGSSPSSLMAMGGVLYFAATDANGDTELWRSNGTDAGTYVVKDIFAGYTSSNPTGLISAGSAIYFIAEDPVGGIELWKSDGTPAGTMRISSANLAPGSNPENMTAIGGVVYFTATTAANGNELWKSDGTLAGTVLVKDINSGGNGSNPSSLTAVSGLLFFAAYDSTNGYELWKSDGSSAGTLLVRDINPGNLNSGPGAFATVGTKLFFGAYDSTYGTQLWTSDGTTTAAVKDLSAGTPAPLSVEDLKSIPTFSLVMDLDDLFDPTTGIYANASQRDTDTADWERPGSLELMFPDDPDEGFQIDAGVRIRGGYSRSPDNPKHAFRILFKQEYGAGELKYPLFGPNGAQSFDNLDLRTFQNYSWSFGGDSRGVFFRDVFSRDTSLAMGQPGTRGNYYHLYINGQYWGLFNTEERPEASYAASYFGGDEADYDVIKVNVEGYNIEATDGNMDAWTEMYNQASAGLASNAAYWKIQGRNPDGTVNPSYKNLVDVDNLIDYMLVVYYTGNFDAPISAFLSNANPNNFYAIRNRKANTGFIFINHDNEHTLLLGSTQAGDGLTVDRTGPYSAGTGNIWKSNPQWLFQQFMANAEFRLRVADHIHKAFFNGGVLTPQANMDRVAARLNEYGRAVAAESARWGDSKVSRPLTRDVEWLNQVYALSATYFPQRSDLVFAQLKADALYPDVAAPTFSQHGGPVTAGFTLGMTAPAGTIYYTLDGSDPRLFGGAISPTAVVYTGPVALSGTVDVKARVLSGGTWSALNEARFSFDLSALRITELMYNPAGPNADDYEFIELMNTGPVAMNLLGTKIDTGIDFTFGSVTLNPGARIVVARNVTAFKQRYPGVPDSQIVGPYTGRLADGGERIRLLTPMSQVLLDFEYKDGWLPQTDGGGYSLVKIDPTADPTTYGLKSAWRASNKLHGGPGVADPGFNPGVIVINEVLAHSDIAGGDFIELYNTTDADIPVGGWFLSDTETNLALYTIPAGKVVPARGYLLLTQQADFGGAFGLSELGEDLYLSSNDGMVVGGYREHVDFGATDRNVSMIRFIKSTGGADFVPAQSITPGQPNAQPLVGPVLINELMYAPPADKHEFIELRNLAGAPVPLYDPLNPQNTWKFTNGITFAFPLGATIPASGYALVVGIDPAVYRATYNIPAAVPIYGPYTGVLDNAGEKLELSRPGEPEATTGFVPYYMVDRVTYEPVAPWPAGANGTGASLSKITPTAYGNDPINWTVDPNYGTPGRANFNLDTDPPTVDIIDVTPDPRKGFVASIQIVFSEPVTGFDLGDLVLTRNGGVLSLASATLNSSDGITWTLGNILPLTTASGEYVLTLVASGSGIKDAANNLLVTGASDSWTTDAIPPTATVGPVAPDPRNTAVDSISIVFSEAVNGFDLADLSLTRGGVAVSLAGAALSSGNNIAWTLSGLGALTSADGVYVLTLSAAGSGITDALGNVMIANASDTWTLDATAPTAAIAPVTPDPRNSPVSAITINFSEAVNGFGLGALSLARNGTPVSLSGATLSTSDNRTWTLGNLSGMTSASGTYLLTLSSTGITDGTGNALAAGAEESWTTDATAPTVAITPVTPDPRNSAVDSVTIVFSEPVGGVDVGDFTLTRNGSAVTLSGASVGSADGITWTLGGLSTVTGVTGSYVLRLVATGSGIADAVGNPLAADASDTFVVDLIKPTFVVGPVIPANRNTAVGSLPIVFSEPVNGFDVGDLTLTRNGVVVPLTGASLSSGDGAAYTLAGLSSLTGQAGSYRISFNAANTGVKDLAGNSTDRAGSTTYADFVIDLTSPTASITPVAPDPRNSAVTSIQIVFSEPVLNFDVSDLSLTRDGIALGLSGASLSTTDGASFTLNGLGAATGLSGDYTLTLNVSDIADAAGNALAAGASESWKTDATAPTVMIGPVSPDPRQVPVDQLTITFSEPVSGLDLGDLSLTRDGQVVMMGAGQSLATGDNRVWTLSGLAELTTRAGSYLITLSAGGSGIVDALGNALAVGADEAFIVNAINGSSVAGDVIRISPGAANPSLLLVQQNDGPAYTVRLDLLPELIVNPGGGPNQVIIDLDGSASIGAGGGIVINGQSGSDSLRIIGSNGADVILLEDGRVTINGSAIGFSNIQSVFIEPGAGDDLTTVARGSALPVQYIGSTGDDTLRITAGTFLAGEDLGVASPSLLLEIVNASFTSSSSQHLAGLKLIGSATAEFTGASGVLRAGELSIDQSAQLDIGENDLILDAAAATRDDVLHSVSAWIGSARNAPGGLWTGPGLTSSAAIDIGNANMGLAALVNDRGGGRRFHTTFAGESVDENAILVRLTPNGDADLNGRLNGDDYFQIDKGFFKSGLGQPVDRVYRNGDFNLDQVIDIDDYILIDAAFMEQWTAGQQQGGGGGTQTAELAATSAVSAATLSGQEQPPAAGDESGTQAALTAVAAQPDTIADAAPLTPMTDRITAILFSDSPILD